MKTSGQLMSRLRFESGVTATPTSWVGCLFHIWGCYYCEQYRPQNEIIIENHPDLISGRTFSTHGREVLSLIRARNHVSHPHILQWLFNRNVVFQTIVSTDNILPVIRTITDIFGRLPISIFNY
jgi:hypothetical protein